MTTRPRSAAMLTVAASLLLSACQGAATSATPAPISSIVGTPGSTSAPASPDALRGCPGPRPFSSLSVLARTDISPDDLLAEPHGAVWVSDPDGGYIEKLDAAGHMVLRSSDPQAPEGMVDEGGTIVVAEQRLNRLVSFIPPSTQRTTVLTLPQPDGQAGLDGIHLDAVGRRLLIPDSPHGRLLSAPLGGSAVTTLATGLGRAVAATVGSDGAIWVAAEGDHGLLRVPRGGGQATAVGGAEVTQLDDLVAGPALLYATSLSTHDVIAIDASNGATRVLVTGVNSPQGLALLSTGRLAITDSTSRVIATASPCAPR